MSNATPTPISEDQVKNVCKIGYGAETCAFVGMVAQGWVCLKGSYVEEDIRERLFEKTMRACSENCSGAPSFLPLAISERKVYGS